HFEVPIVTRTAEELRDVVKNNPFLRAGKDAAKLHVAFLIDEPEPDRVATLDAARSLPDEFAVRGREIYLHLPHEIARTSSITRTSTPSWRRRAPSATGAPSSRFSTWHPRTKLGQKIGKSVFAPPEGKNRA